MLWQQVLDDCKRQVTKDEWKSLKAVAVEDVRGVIRQQQTQYDNKTLPKWLEKIGNAIDLLRPFMSVVDTFVQADPTTSALVWGSIRAVIEVRERPFGK